LHNRKGDKQLAVNMLIFDKEICYYISRSTCLKRLLLELASEASNHNFAIIQYVSTCIYESDILLHL